MVKRDVTVLARRAVLPWSYNYIASAWRHRLAFAAEAACRPAVECYRPRQTTTDDRRRRRQTPATVTCLPLTLGVGGPVINRFRWNLTY